MGACNPCAGDPTGDEVDLYNNGVEHMQYKKKKNNYQVKSGKA